MLTQSSLSLASHTIQSQEKEGLVIMCIVSCTHRMQKTPLTTANLHSSYMCAYVPLTKQQIQNLEAV